MYNAVSQQQAKPQPGFGPSLTSALARRRSTPSVENISDTINYVLKLHFGLYKIPLWWLHESPNLDAGVRPELECPQSPLTNNFRSKTIAQQEKPSYALEWFEDRSNLRDAGRGTDRDYVPDSTDMLSAAPQTRPEPLVRFTATTKNILDSQDVRFGY